MHVENDTDMSRWIAGTLTEMRNLNMPIISESCPHCGIPIRYPLIARKTDIEAFSRMLNTAAIVMREYGITGNLLADIRAKCLINIAKKHDV